MVTKQDWFSINNIVLSMYSTPDDTIMMENFLKALNVLIPFDVGVYMKAEIHDNKAEVSKPVFIGTNEKFIEEYCEFATSSDYASPLMSMGKSIAYRDTDLLDEKRRKDTVFYRDFLQKHDILYVGGMILVMQGELLGEVTLYRNEKKLDFNDDELAILNILRPHLDNRLYYKLVPKEADASNEPTNKNLKKYTDLHLTQREMQIADLMMSGYGYEDISDKLVISINTTKKHVSNMFRKLDVTNRMELIKLFTEETDF